MTKRKVWRYTCEWCGKSNCSGGAIAKHELHCTKNPNRVCRMCARVGDKQATMAELLRAIQDAPIIQGHFEIGFKSLDPLRAETHNCPACILAALRQMEDDRSESVV